MTRHVQCMQEKLIKLMNDFEEEGYDTQEKEKCIDQ